MANFDTVSLYPSIDTNELMNIVIKGIEECNRNGTYSDLI